jgi:hypothetical protein
MIRAWIHYHHLALWAIPPILETIEAMLSDEPASHPLRGEVDFLWGHHWFWHGETIRSLDWFHRSLEHLPENLQWARGDAGLFWGVACQMSGQKIGAVQTLNKWLNQGQTPHPGRQTKLLGR